MRTRIVGVALALLVGFHKGLLAALPTNDDFMHRTYARQLLAGEWPLRDFFDYGMVLMYVLSAIVETVAGHRLLAEAVIIGAAAAISTYLIYTIVRRATGSAVFAFLAGSLVLLAGPRGFSYPKLIIYAVAAYLWWMYAREPRARTAIAAGVWMAAAYYWRADHGVLVAAGFVLSALAAHGLRPIAFRRSALAGSVSLALVLPFWIFAATQVGFGTFVRSGITAAAAQHSVSQAAARWPLRRPGDFLRVDAAETFAPRVAIRWTRDSSPQEREATLARHHITVESADGPDTQRVRLSEDAVERLRELIASPYVEDTAGVDRGSATLPWSTWPAWERWRFRHQWLRVRLLPGIDEHTRAGAVAQIMLYVIPVLAACFGVIPSGRRFLPAQIDGVHLACFAAFAVVVNAALVRTPYEVRANDGIVLPAVLFGIWLAIVWRVWLLRPGVTRLLTGGAFLVVGLLVVKSVAVTGEFSSGINWLAGDWRSSERALGAWRGAGERLWASPPDEFWPDGAGPITARLGEYARACVSPSEPILVLWFAPEIYYYADRLMGGRHLHFTPAFRTLPEEQQQELEKVRRTSPLLAFTSSEFEAATAAAFPAMMEYVRHDYAEVVSVEDDGTRYRVLARREARPSSRYGKDDWPCYR
jgi:hypothetical protein